MTTTEPTPATCAHCGDELVGGRYSVGRICRACAEIDYGDDGDDGEDEE